MIMSKAIMISIKPKWVAKILNGEKIIEIRKTMPKCDLPIDVYIYCTKQKDDGLLRLNGKRSYYVKGKVVARFTLNKVETITYDSIFKLFSLNRVLYNSCLKEEELNSYLKGELGYAWRIDDLVIFEKPKELRDFNLTKAPQSYCYVERRIELYE